MKRFWSAAIALADDDGWAISLDDRPILTPAKAKLVVPTLALGHAIAREWAAVEDEVDPRALPLTGLANAAIDRTAPHRAAFAQSLARYAETDLFCYRAETPPTLVARQAESWDPLLAWARRRFDVDFTVTSGLTHVEQPPATVERLTHAVVALDAFRLAGLSPLVTIGGSLVAALAVLEKAVTADRAWQAASVDERWQLEQWGADAEAEAILESRHRDFMAGASFLVLLDA